MRFGKSVALIFFYVRQIKANNEKYLLRYNLEDNSINTIDTIKLVDKNNEIKFSSSRKVSFYLVNDLLYSSNGLVYNLKSNKIVSSKSDCILLIPEAILFVRIQFFETGFR